MPIHEIQSGSGGQKMQSLIQTYNYYLQMIRDVTGLNEARDGSTPDPKALVGVQKMAAANSNTATRHILQSGLYLTSQVAECLSLRISDILEYSPTADAFVQAIGAHNVATLNEMSNLHLYDFGIFLELTPDDEEKAMLEQNIQIALQKESIELEDAIDLRDIKNIKLANQLLKIRRIKKAQNDQQVQQQNIQAQSQAQMEQQQAAAQTEIMKQSALSQAQMQLEQAKAEIATLRAGEEFHYKKEIMNLEYSLQMEIERMKLDTARQGEVSREDRKDERTRIQATQQSEMIDQRNNDKSPKNYEKTSNNILGGDYNF